MRIVLWATPRYLAAWPSVSHSGCASADRSVPFKSHPRGNYPNLQLAETLNRSSAGGRDGDGHRPCRRRQRLRLERADVGLRSAGRRAVLERPSDRDADQQAPRGRARPARASRAGRRRRPPLTVRRRRRLRPAEPASAAACRRSRHPALRVCTPRTIPSGRAPRAAPEDAVSRLVVLRSARVEMERRGLDDRERLRPPRRRCVLGHGRAAPPLRPGVRRRELRT